MTATLIILTTGILAASVFAWNIGFGAVAVFVWASVTGAWWNSPAERRKRLLASWNRRKG
jgi:hypothetical protein